jgi:hypothetical protein
MVCPFYKKCPQAGDNDECHQEYEHQTCPLYDIQEKEEIKNFEEMMRKNLHVYDTNFILTSRKKRRFEYKS